MYAKVVLPLVLFALVDQYDSGNYELVLSDEEIFSECQGMDAIFKNISYMFDFSHFNSTLRPDGMAVEGNLTVVWNIHPGDRIELAMQLLYMDRGTWQPTVFSINTKDFCKIMYDKRQFWYKFWTKHILNVDVIKDRCLTVPGTYIIMDPYLLVLVASTQSTGMLREGRYKTRIIFRAFDPFNSNERTDPVCFEVRGEVFKL
ncbi:hypothetical protein KR074_004464 [Drosophila pseudoananassae]|nr:hypothetical protein KR074_004464 [Drosophila pseudoananassae]